MKLTCRRKATEGQRGAGGKGKCGRPGRNNRGGRRRKGRGWRRRRRRRKRERDPGASEGQVGEAMAGLLAWRVSAAPRGVRVRVGVRVRG